jgi:hypothetical protein
VYLMNEITGRMPITIIRRQAETDILVASPADDDWSLSSQIVLLESWVETNAHKLPSGEYVADIGFCWRKDAAGGGAALDRGFLKKLADSGFSLFLSEYPGFAEGDDDPANADRHDTSRTINLL